MLKSTQPPTNLIKEIDWQLVNSDKSLSSQYTIAVKNKFDSISVPEDTIETVYNNIKSAVEEIALETLPKKPKKKNTPINSHHLVRRARKELLDAQRKYSDNHTIPIKRKVRKAQQFLDRAYATAQAEFIQGQNKAIGKLHREKKHTAAWKP